ncbi:MAG TPA: hypothetical protein VEB00_13695 [Clostridia bacterium]|nr:hypothetical protein [Clostridia bacterium]
MDIKVRVKYCGGCNPNYDRKGIVNVIDKKLDINLAAYDENEIPDVTLVICGCSSDCIKIDEYKSKYGTMLISSPEQIEEVIKYIKSVKL